MESLFENKTPINTIKERSLKIWSAITDPKKIRSFISNITLIVILIFSVIGMFVTFGYLNKYVDYNRECSALATESVDGNQVFLCEDTIRRNGNGLVAGTTKTKLGRDSELYYQKMLEAKQHGINPIKVWGIERDIEVNPKDKGYRVVAERIIGLEGEPLVTYSTLEKYWKDTTIKPTPQKSVIDRIMRWHNGHR